MSDRIHTGVFNDFHGKSDQGLTASRLAAVLPNGKSQVRALVFVSGVAQFAADVPLKDSKLMAATQGPITEAALNESGDTPAWKTIPSWFLHGSLDKNIPPAVHAFMAKRAGAKRAVEVKGASHVVMISHPDALVKLIDEAAEQAR